MTDSGTVDIHSDAFARRLANLLAQRRRERGTSLRKLARASGRAFSAHELRAFEEARASIDAQRLDAVAELYDADLQLILADRLSLEVRPAGVLITGGIAQSFTPGDETSLLTSYLRLVRQLRSAEQAPSIELRREDVEVLAEHLGQAGATIVERLGALMGATVAQRRAMAGLFLSGAVVIGLAGGSVAALGVGGGGSNVPDTSAPSRDAATTTVVTVDPSTLVVERIGDVSGAARSLPSIVLDGESHGAPNAVPLPATPDSTGSTTPAPDAAPPPDSTGSTIPAPDVAPPPPPATPTTLAPAAGDDVLVTEDTAVSPDGSVGVGAPVVPTTLDPEQADEDAYGVADIVDDEDLTDLFGDVPIAADVGEPPVPFSGESESAVAPPPVP